MNTMGNAPKRRTRCLCAAIADNGSLCSNYGIILFGIRKKEQAHYANLNAMVKSCLKNPYLCQFHATEFDKAVFTNRGMAGAGKSIFTESNCTYQPEERPQEENT